MTSKPTPTHGLRIAKYGRDPITDSPVYLSGCWCGWVAPGDGPKPIARRLADCKTLWQAHVDESEAVAA